MCRAHYLQDESAFASSAAILARGSKVPSFRIEIERIIREGRAHAESKRRDQWSQGRQQPGTKPLDKLPEAQAPNEMMKRLDGPAFADLLLPREIQATFDEIVTELEFRDELKERGLRARDRILLHGPPGNGKTSSAVAIAKQLGVPCWGVNISEVFGQYLGSTSKNIKALIEAAPNNAVTVLDEIDAIGGSRNAYGSQACDKELNASVNTLLTTLDRSCKGIIVATTNRLDILDSALRRRFEEVIEIPGPTIEQMRALASSLCFGFGVDPVYVDDCENFDAVTKACKREARRIVMKQILAADTADEEENDGQEDNRKAAE
jgi:SpoVK/Ycf46/Vps4 family AAA+-type ATPase